MRAKTGTLVRLSRAPKLHAKVDGCLAEQAKALQVGCVEGSSVPGRCAHSPSHGELEIHFDDRRNESLAQFKSLFGGEGFSATTNLARSSLVN